jgi:hypothetical protein
MYLGAFPRYAIAGWIGLLPGIVRENKIVEHIRSKIESFFVFISSFFPFFPKASVANDQMSSHHLTRTTNIFLIFVIVYSFMRNLRTVNFDKRDDYFPTTINRFGFLLRLDQYRAMFSPYPKIDDGRYNITGITAFDDKRINISHPDRPPFDTKPSHKEIVTIVPHEKWRKLIDNLWQRSNSQYRQYFAAYLCRIHNTKATKYTRVKSVNLTYMQENTKLDYQTDPVVAVDLGTWDCK